MKSHNKRLYARHHYPTTEQQIRDQLKELNKKLEMLIDVLRTK